MKTTPGLFNPPMVRAILAGIKTNTRRPMNVQPDEDGLAFNLIRKQWEDTSGKVYKSPYGGVGDLVWARERTEADVLGSVSIGIYYADKTQVVSSNNGVQHDNKNNQKHGRHHYFNHWPGINSHGSGGNVI